MYCDAIRNLCAEDLEFAQELRSIAGWNQTDADWRRLLDFGDAGCFLIHCDGHPAGTATTTVFAETLGWIGMILVHPSFRGRGLATAMVNHCLDYLLRQRNIACVKLDATAEGRPLYAKLGFQVDYDLTRWARSRIVHGVAQRLGLSSPANGTSSPPTASILSDDSQEWLALDRAVQGVDRGPFLRRLARDSRWTIRYGSQGYGMLRDGAEAHYLGPVVATDPSIGHQLVTTLLDAASAGSNDCDAVFWDIPDDNTAAGRLAEQLGFVRQRPLIRMWTGRENLAADRQAQWAISGPETG